MNADLSPAELKAALKKVKGEAVTYRNYITALEGEICIWRSGGTVPEAQWASPSGNNNAPGGALTNGRQTPTSNDSHPAVKSVAMGSNDERPFTPTITLEKDERDQFLQRENELTELIAEKVRRRGELSHQYHMQTRFCFFMIVRKRNCLIVKNRCRIYKKNSISARNMKRR